MIEINYLIKKYAGRTVLDIDSLKIEDGETLVVIGPNGSGKSTLLKLISGIIKPSGGSVSGCEGVLYLPQQSLAFSKSVEDNILLCANCCKAEAKAKAEKLIGLMGLEHLKDKKANTLSGGELQKTALCRLLINKCGVLVLDEPTGPADIESAETIRNAIKEYKTETGCTVVMTTHSPAEAKTMADRLIMLYDGKIIEDGRPDEMLLSPRTEWGEKFISQWKI